MITDGRDKDRENNDAGYCLTMRCFKYTNKISNDGKPVFPFQGAFFVIFYVLLNDEVGAREQFFFVGKIYQCNCLQLSC
jgi:hypothetical protein